MPSSPLYDSDALQTALAAQRLLREEIYPGLPMLVLDAEASIRHVTPALRGLLEYTARQDLEPCFFSHVHEKSLGRVMRDLAAMVSYGKKEASWFLRLCTGRGRWRWFKATVENRLREPEASILVVVREVHG